MAKSRKPKLKPRPSDTRHTRPEGMGDTRDWYEPERLPGEYRRDKRGGYLNGRGDVWPERD